MPIRDSVGYAIRARTRPQIATTQIGRRRTERAASGSSTHAEPADLASPDHCTELSMVGATGAKTRVYGSN
jgi:hypothetical protein